MIKLYFRDRVNARYPLATACLKLPMVLLQSLAMRCAISAPTARRRWILGALSISCWSWIIFFGVVLQVCRAYGAASARIGYAEGGTQRRRRGISVEPSTQSATVHLRVIGRFRTKESVGGTPTEAVGTTALPKKSGMTGVSGSISPTNQRCTAHHDRFVFENCIWNLPDLIS